MSAWWGPLGEKLISVMIAIAALTSVNGSMIVGARSTTRSDATGRSSVSSAAGDEAERLARTAMLVQGAIALALVVFGAFQNAGFKGLVEYSLPVVLGVFHADRDRALHPAGEGARCAAALPRAGVSRPCLEFRAELRLPALLSLAYHRATRSWGSVCSPSARRLMLFATGDDHGFRDEAGMKGIGPLFTL